MEQILPGCCLVQRKWLDEKMATYLGNVCRQHIPWRKVTIYGKKIMQARRVFGLADGGINHTYSGQTLTSLDWNNPVYNMLGEYFPEDIRKSIWEYFATGLEQVAVAVKQVRDRIARETQVQFNNCLLNEYATGADYISYHSDKEMKLPYVVTVSLLGSRDFYFKTKTEPFETIKTQLHNGDAVVMYGKCQQLYTHSIPKRAHADYRISLTFRVL